MKIITMLSKALSFFKKLGIKTNVWKFRLDEPFMFQGDKNLDRGYYIYDASGRIVAGIESDGLIFAEVGFCWNGCDPTIQVGDFFIGTPDGAIDQITGKPKTYYASLLHDILCQLIRQNKRFPISRLEADQAFADLLKRDGFKHHALYYRIVRLFGAPYGRVMALINGESRGRSINQ